MARNQQEPKAPAAEGTTPTPAAPVAAPARKTGATAFDWMIETGNDLGSVAKKVGWGAAILFVLGNKSASEAVADAFGTAVEGGKYVKDVLFHEGGEVSQLAEALDPHARTFQTNARARLMRDRLRRMRSNTPGGIVRRLLGFGS